MAVTVRTDQEILDALRDALYSGAVRKGQDISINGRRISAFSIPELTTAIAVFENKVKSSQALRPAVASFGRPS